MKHWIRLRDTTPDGQLESLDGVDRTVLGYELQPVQLGQPSECIAGGLQVQTGVLNNVVLLLLSGYHLGITNCKNMPPRIYLCLLTTTAGIVLVLFWYVHLHGLSVTQQVGEPSWHLGNEVNLPWS